MFWLFVQYLWYLLGALALGVLVGWLWWGRRLERSVEVTHDVRRQLSSSQAATEQLAKEHEAAKRQLVSVGDVSKQHGDAVARIGDLERALATARGESSTQAGQVASATSRLRELEGSLGVSSKKIQEHEAALAAARQRTQELEAALAASTTRAQEHAASLGGANALLQERESSLGASASKVQELETGLTAAAARVQEQEAALAVARQRARELEAGLAASAATAQQHETALAAANGRIEEHASALASLRARHDQLANEHAELQGVARFVLPPLAERVPSGGKLDDLTIVEGIGPKMADALQAAGIHTFEQLSNATVPELHAAIEASGLSFAPSIPTWSKQAALLARGDREGFDTYTSWLVAGVPPTDGSQDPLGRRFRAADRLLAMAGAAPARAAEPAFRLGDGPDDLTIIEGVGPKMSAALHAAGIHTFADVSAATEAQLRAAVAAAGLPFAPSIPTWARQAEYLVKGDTAGFTAYTDHLIAGREPGTD